MKPNNSTLKIDVYLTLALGIIWTLFSLQFLNQGIFWDLGIYEKAVAVFNEGGNPYALNGYLSFVYHPLVLRLMALFGSSLGVALIVFYALSVLFFLKNLGANHSWWIFAFLAFAYCGLGTISIGSGNVTVFFHLILLGILLGKIKKVGTNAPASSFNTFGIAVALFSLVKPYMLAYFLIPLISSWKTSSQKSIWSTTLLLAVFCGLILFGSSLYFGSEFQAFLAAVQGQTIGKHDLGYGLVMYFYEYYLSAGPLLYRAFVLHFVILLAISLATLVLAYRKNILNQSSFTLLLYFLLTLLNPRLKVYDLFPALAALFIFISFHQSTISKWIFALAYTLSLSQLTDTPLFAHQGLLADPLNVYYLTMGLILISTLFSLKPSTKPALKS